MVRAPRSGVLVYKAALGDQLRKGDLIAWVVDPAANEPTAARTEVRSPTDGLLLTRVSRRFVQASGNVAKVVGRDPLEDRQAGKLLSD